MMPELEKTAAVAVEKMKLEEAARRKLEERLITVSQAAIAVIAMPASELFMYHDVG